MTKNATFYETRFLLFDKNRPSFEDIIEICCRCEVDGTSGSNSWTTYTAEVDGEEANEENTSLVAEVLGMEAPSDYFHAWCWEHAMRWLEERYWPAMDYVLDEDIEDDSHVARALRGLSESISGSLYTTFIRPSLILPNGCVIRSMRNGTLAPFQFDWASHTCFGRNIDLLHPDSLNLDFWLEIANADLLKLRESFGFTEVPDCGITPI